MSIITFNEEKKLEIQKRIWKAAADKWYESKVSEGFVSQNGIKLGLTQGDVSLLTGNFVLAKEADAMGLAIPPVIGMTGEVHNLTIEELTALMLEYGQARALISTMYADIASGETELPPEPDPEADPEPEPEEDTPEEE